MKGKTVLEIIENYNKSGVTILNLADKGIKSLPESIGKLTNLEELYLQRNQLNELPDTIGNLINLRVLHINLNQLNKLPDSIGNLAKLTTLHIYSNKLTSLPNSITNLKNLKQLYIDMNQFSDWPIQLDHLGQIVSFSSDINLLPTLIRNKEKFAKLQTLALDSQGLRKFPKEICELTTLSCLYIDNNMIVSLPDCIGNLTSLKWLDLSKNQLTEIPDTIGHNINLKWLDLSKNQLTELPKTIGNLTYLTSLCLDGNQLTALPETITNLNRLNILGVKDNQLISPPLDIIKHGSNAILDYLRELEKKSKKRYEAKLLMLGDGGEGKTCVSRALRGLEFKPQVTTRGVEVVPWNFSRPEDPNDKDKEITLNIWDFEGQEIHHQTHQFFLTEGALYILVFKCREMFRMDRAEYWLDTIRARAPKSKVLLVITECEERTPYLPLDKLENNYGDLFQGDNWFFPVGCETNKGIPELRNYLQKTAAEIDMMGLKWPFSYSEAEKEIEDKADEKGDNIQHMTRQELYDIYQDNGINENSFEDVANFMDMLGIITHFPDCPDLRDFVVIKPQWLTKAISLILEDKLLKDDQGEITLNRLRKLWEAEYSGLYSTFHNCMKEFELCYDLEFDQRCLIPLRFGHIKPEVPWTVIENYKERRIEYKLNIRPPMGIMSRYIVKTHHMIAKSDKLPKGVYWHNGVFLRTGERTYKSEALCEFDNENKILSIAVRAAFPQNMIEQLHGIVKAVFSFFKGLEPERYYGCVKKDKNKEIKCEGKHSEERILFALTRQKVVDCEVGWHEINPNYLVYGFTSFGQFIKPKEPIDKIEEILKMVKSIKKDVLTSKSILDDLMPQVFEIRRQGKQLPAEIKQQLELSLRDHLIWMDEMLDNREYNSAPGIVSITPVSKTKWNPKNWFQQEYIVVPYCEFEGEIHRIEGVCKPFKKPREWWQKSAPKLAVGFKILSVGMQITCAGLPMSVDPKLLETIKDETDFMKEMVSHFEFEGKVDSDISSDSEEFVEISDNKILDMRQKDSEDLNRIARQQLAELLEQIAPENYKSRQWGSLRRVRMSDNTYRWLCEKHAKKMGK